MSKRVKYLLIGAFSAAWAYTTYYAITSSAVPAHSEAATLATSFGMGLLVMLLLAIGPRAITRIPTEQRTLVGLSLAGWSLTCLLLMVVLSVVELLAIFLLESNVRPPIGWIITRAVSAGFLLALLPALLIVKLAGRSKQLVS